MSGIVGLVDGSPVARDLIEALGRLEHRGDDAVGMAVAGPGFSVRKLQGRSSGLDAMFSGDSDAVRGRIGIAQTQWAPFGPTDAPVGDPLVWGGIAVVHDGLIQNRRELRAELRAGLPTNEKMLDAEGDVIPRLIAAARARGAGPLEAVRWVTGRLRGAYSLAVMFQDDPDVLLVASQGSPVVVARHPTGAGVASDPQALRGLCDDFSHLEEGDIAELRLDGVRILDRGGQVAVRQWQKVVPALEMEPEEGYIYHTRGDIAANAASAPWDYTQSAEPIDLDLQKRLYQAYFNVWYGNPKLGGFMMWEWPPGEAGTEDRGYTPQGKPAEDVLKHWLAKPAWKVD